jgi:serine protease AprX
VKVTLFVLGFLLAGASFALVSPDLEGRLASAQPDQFLPVNIVLKEQFDTGLLNALVADMPRAQRRVEVARVLKEFAAERQADLLSWLSAAGARNVTSLWIVNAVHCDASPELIRQISGRPEVAFVSYDLVYAPGILDESEPVPARDEVPWGVERINAPAVWDQGFTGAGIVVGIIDTGCKYDHPDFADHLWTDPNYPLHGWDFENNDNDPMDSQGHGTMTAGCVASDGTAGSQCGAAPDAELMVLRVMTTVDTVAESQTWAAMQFCVAPPLSPGNGADLYNMSLGWAISWNPRMATWRTLMTNIAAAGLSQIIAAGASAGSPPPYGMRCPGNVPPPWWNPQNTGVGTLSGAVTVNATDSSDYIASFAGCGPVTWDTVTPFLDYAYPPGLTKPDLCAPGVEIKTCALTGGYTVVSGTSWAAGFATGTAALMLSMDPEMTPAEIDSILEVTAVDRGGPGKDTVYGAGRIDALAAVAGVQENRQLTPQGLRLTVTPNPFRRACRVTAPAGAVVEVLDAGGRRLTALRGGGMWNPAADVRPGIYFARARDGSSSVKVVYAR